MFSKKCPYCFSMTGKSVSPTKQLAAMTASNSEVKQRAEMATKKGCGFFRNSHASIESRKQTPSAINADRHFFLNI